MAVARRMRDQLARLPANLGIGGKAIRPDADRCERGATSRSLAVYHRQTFTQVQIFLKLTHLHCCSIRQLIKKDLGVAVLQHMR
jgi:hypothetical protein